jgi:hypothetical protein
MSIQLNKKATIKELDEALLKLKSGKLFIAKKHVGKVKWGEDALKFQRRIRDEWN